MVKKNESFDSSLKSLPHRDSVEKNWFFLPLMREETIHYHIRNDFFFSHFHFPKLFLEPLYDLWNDIRETVNISFQCSMNLFYFLFEILFKL